MDEKELNSVRIDKWLWAARFFKTRSLATKAVAGGKVHLNGNRVKAARAVEPGDTMTITIGTAEYHISVLALSERRGPATMARQLYEESEESSRAREEQREMRRMAGAGISQSAGRPDKRNRRKIREFIRKN
ncbi:RNA-binding protein [Desulforhopalus vacuolatus]|uniref:RNA-binding S4 domain-containing protein n=1 Tax=Desulforhopalus vacuolatus TaxID=40414 RepID=UPI001965107E|nr:S4 domain-containing protein [Desulforhopalus vacuolatus]MBM9520493.1 RNA-binding protein [Desulforhopalus vacuolatus]